MSLQDFIAKYQGQAVSYDGLAVDRGQCVQLAELYMEQVLEIPVPLYPGAADYIERGVPGLSIVPKASGPPQTGDVVVFERSIDTVGNNGHIDICVSGGDPFQGFDTNWDHAHFHDANNYPTAHLVSHDLSQVTGYLRKEDMAEIIDVNTSRVIAHGILARNGVAGRGYALDGSQGDPWVGGELTNQFIQDVFNSPEARQWRDSSDDNSVKGINTRLTELAKLKAQPAPAPTPVPDPSAVTVTKDGLWASFKKFLGL